MPLTVSKPKSIIVFIEEDSCKEGSTLLRNSTGGARRALVDTWLRKLSRLLLFISLNLDENIGATFHLMILIKISVEVATFYFIIKLKIFVEAATFHFMIR